jgi:uncharacterized OB-fold protein
MTAAPSVGWPWRRWRLVHRCRHCGAQYVDPRAHHAQTGHQGYDNMVEHGWRGSVPR